MTENQLDNEGMPREIWAGMDKHGETFWTRHLMEAAPVSIYAKGMTPTKYTRTPSQDDLVKRLEALKKPMRYFKDGEAVMLSDDVKFNAAIDDCISEVKK